MAGRRTPLVLGESLELRSEESLVGESSYPCPSFSESRWERERFACSPEAVPEVMQKPMLETENCPGWLGESLYICSFIPEVAIDSCDEITC
jgi:hypothetical protein